MADSGTLVLTRTGDQTQGVADAPQNPKEVQPNECAEQSVLFLDGESPYGQRVAASPTPNLTFREATT